MYYLSSERDVGSKMLIRDFPPQKKKRYVVLLLLLDILTDHDGRHVVIAF